MEAEHYRTVLSQQYGGKSGYFPRHKRLLPH
jgi:hypothetical protein